jgi:hypothetical protein
MSGRKNGVAAQKRVRRKRAIESAIEPLLFGPAPLVEGEDEATYGEFLARISSAVKPKDFLEEIWVRDVVDLSWEALRMRRIKAKLLKSVLSPGFYDYSTTIDSVERIDRMVMSAEARRNAALREIERHRAGLAEALRRATDDVVDADFEDIAPGKSNAPSRRMSGNGDPHEDEGGMRYEHDEEDAA